MLADAAYHLALAEYDALVKDFPNSPNFRRNVVNTWYSIGSVWAFGGKPADGLAAFGKARDLAAAIVKDYPDDTQMKEQLAGIEDTIRKFTPEKK